MNGFLFLLPFFLIISLGIYQDSFAAQEYRGYDYSVIQNFDGSFTKTLGLQPYIYDNSTNSFLPYINSGLRTETEHGSVELNSDGTYSYFPNGRINGTELFTDHIIAKYADISDLTVWTYPNTLNNDTPDNTWSADSFISSKVKAGTGILDYKYILNNGKWKTQLEATNLSYLNTKAFGFDQVIDLNSDTIRFGGIVRNLDNFDGTTFSKSFLDNNQGKVIDLMNGYYFDFDLGYENLYSVTVQDTGVGKSRLIFDYRTTTPLLPDETLVIDPNFGPISGTMYRALTSNSVSTSCGAGSTIDSTETIYKGASAGSDNCRVYAPEFSLTNIPDNAVPTDVTLKYTVATATNAINCDYKPMASSPSGLSASALYTDITDGTAYVSNDATCTTTGAKSLSLGATAVTDLTNALTTTDTFSVGMSFNSMTRDGSAHTVAMTGGTTTLTITYNLPPNPPRIMNGTITPSTGVNMFWSEPAHNGGTGTISYNVKRSVDGSTYTSLANTTSVSYSDTEPLQQNYGYYRAYSSDSLGQSGGYSFPLNQTSSTALRLSVPYDYTLVNQKNATNTLTTTGNELYVAGHNGGARYFDNVSYDTVSTESLYDVEHTTPFSISGWAYRINANTDGVVSKGNDFVISGGVDPGWYIFTGSAFNFRLIDSASNTFTVTSGNTPQNELFFFAVTYSGNSNQDGMKIYINCVLEGTGTSSAISNSILNNRNVVIGAESDGGAIYDGYIDDLRFFYNHELSTNEVSQICNERLDTSNLAMYPHAVTDLVATTNVDLSTVSLAWTEPFVFGGTDGYMINYTTPFGDPVTILTNNTESTTTSASVLGLSIGSDYSFRVSAWNFLGTNGSGNIANTTVSTNYVIGNFSSLDIPNTNDFSIFYTRTDINATSLFLNVTYPNTYVLECNMYYQFARTNNTYSNLTSTVVDADNDMSSFQFINATGDVIDVNCYDTLTGDSSMYVLTITQFAFLDMIADMRNGTYGTYFDIGAIDGITLFAIFIGMIGFNRTTPIVGIMFLIITTVSLSFFGIITYPIIMYPALALMGLWAFISTRKDD